ncbi:MAG: SLC13 family permease [Peptococcaceae bacterium]|nr:SLC13 family permease [Peptococcaceae bacterium]
MSIAKPKKILFVHYVIVFALCFLFRFIPGFAGITPLGMGVLGSFLGAVYGWIAIDMLWPSIMALVGIGLSIGMNQMYAASIGSMTIICLIFCMPLIGICNETGAFSWLINKLLTNKFMQGKAWITIWVILLIAWIAGPFNPIIMAIIFCAFATQIFKQVGVKNNEKLPIFMYLGISYAAMMGQILFPFMGTGLTLIMAYNNMFPDTPLDFAKYLLFMIPSGIVMVTVYVLLMRFVFRVDVSKVADFKLENKEAKKIKKDQKKALLIFVVFMVLSVCSSLPLGAVQTFLSQFNIGGITLCMLAVIALMKKEDGSPLCDLEQGLKSVNWGQVTMVGYIMVIATYMNTPDTGIPNAMSMLLQPFMGLPPLVFIIVALAFAALLTNFANNMIVVVLIMPFMFNFSHMIGMEPTGMICLLFLLSQFALMTPAASPVTAVCMTQEMAEARLMTKAAIKIVPLLFIVSVALGWPLAQILF